jgi:hypothetical protein
MPKVPEEQISPHLLKLIGVRGLCDRYGGISLRTIDRWLDKKIIPPPDRMISGRRSWLVEKLDASDRQHLLDAAAAHSVAAE